MLRTDYRLWRPGKWWWEGDKGAIEGCHGHGRGMAGGRGQRPRGRKNYC